MAPPGTAGSSDKVYIHVCMCVCVCGGGMGRSRFITAQFNTWQQLKCKHDLSLTLTIYGHFGCNFFSPSSVVSVLCNSKMWKNERN